MTPPTTSQEIRPQKELVSAWTLLLIRDSRDAHGYTLHQGLASRGVVLPATSVYRLLAKFERLRWVRSRWSESIEGPPRHLYELTASGRSALAETTLLVAAMRDTYGTFVAEHARAVARRGDELAAGDGAAVPVVREVRAPTDGAGGGAPRERSALRPVRPHKELLAGWMLLVLDGGATYGYDLRRAFEAQRLSLDAAAMYRMLRRLEADRWVQSRWIGGSGTGPRRRYYRLTAPGRRSLDEIARLVADIRATHDSYLQAYAGSAAESHGPAE